MKKETMSAKLEEEIAAIRVELLNAIVKKEQMMVDEIPQSLLCRIQVPAFEVQSPSMPTSSIGMIGKLLFMKLPNRDRWEFYLDEYNQRRRFPCIEIEDPWVLYNCLEAMDKYYQHCLEVSRGDMESLRKFRRELRQDMEWPEQGMTREGPQKLQNWVLGAAKTEDK